MIQASRREFVGGLAAVAVTPAIGFAAPAQPDRLYIYNYQLGLWSVIDAIDGYFVIPPNEQYVAMKVTPLSKDDIKNGPAHYVDSITILPNQAEPYRMAASKF